MPGQHSNPTIAFRPTRWEQAMIEERVKASGLYKKDFIARSCIYSNIVVVGTKQRVQYLVEELRETQIVMEEITDEGNEYTYWGTLMEDVIRHEFMKRTGLKVRQNDYVA